MNTVAVPFSVHCLVTVNNSLIKPIRRQSACSDVTGHVTPLLPVPMATPGEVTMYSCILCDVYISVQQAGRKVTFKLVAFFYICATVINCRPPPLGSLSSGYERENFILVHRIRYFLCSPRSQL